MGAAATGSVSVNTARKDGKRYSWGAERPGVIEKRVQSRKEQIDAEMAKIREEGEQWIARRLAAKEAEKKKLDDQEVLVAEHRKALRERRRAFRVTNSYIVPKGTFTDEQVAAIKAQYPGIDDEEAHLLLSKRARQTMEPDVSGPEPVSPQETDAAVPSASTRPGPVVEQRAKPVEAPKVVASEKPKPAAVHNEASVTFSPGAGEAERDWSDFDPEAWEEGQLYPEHLYRAVQNQDRDYYLVPNTEMDEVVEPVATSEIQALRDRQRKLEKAQDDIFERFGRNSMLWTPEVNAEVGRLDQEATDVSIQLRKTLAAQ
ncbi:hypothetical protein [Microvirga sp. VF16]|uniref:hypothetical protein n=1 Tax=Microvirga sp. VF16 TaxID=2807101 RepID=UPI00193CCF85|nr:hypothetical protein [Microvirga sp. VF16]QRM34949.1 hypothetical protein JO965_42580 [Microvirga sp. VF16]